MPFKRYLTIVVIVLLLLIHAGCGDKKSHKDSDDTPRDLNEITKTQENEQVIPKVKNPLTGIDMDIQYEKQRPLAVMIENEYNARPQSGLNKAGDRKSVV